ncbi:cutinase family protein, partial [Mycobacterium sp. E1386]|uniref:cutinase family protein n=1 Tax=Mycobacterium sp. E1386 TaxID=1834126 RepID=UPI0035195CBB
MLNRLPGLPNTATALTLLASPGSSAGADPKLPMRSPSGGTPASYNFLQTADGANDARDHIAEMADQCPATKLVLGGFSQGAAAVSMLAG